MLIHFHNQFKEKEHDRTSAIVQGKNLAVADAKLGADDKKTKEEEEAEDEMETFAVKVRVYMFFVLKIILYFHFSNMPKTLYFHILQY